MKLLTLGMIIMFIFGIIVFYSIFNIEFKTGKVTTEIKSNDKYIIEINENGFSQELIYIKRGDSVTWVNNYKYPQILASDTWKTRLIMPNENFTIIFFEKTEDKYFSLINETFKGEIIVLD